FLVLAAILLAVDRANTRHARAQIAESLNVGSRVFTRLYDTRADRLIESVRILSSDFALRGAIATRDRDTIFSALENHGARIGAGIVLLVSLDNSLLVNTLRPRAVPEPFPFPRLTEVAALRGEAASIVFFGDRAFQLVVVPVLAPDPIAWVCMGFRIDERLAQELQRITSAHVSFLRADDQGRWSTLATTLTPRFGESLMQGLPPGIVGQNQPMGLDLGGEEFETRVLPLAAEGDTSVVAVLQLSLDEAMAPFRRLRVLLIALTGAGLLVSLGGSIVLARRVTQPVDALAEGARRIALGDYGHEMQVTQSDELGRLAQAFNHMSRGIAEREGRIRYLAYHDELTGLPNRLSLEEHLQRRLARAGGVGTSLLLVALDRFRDINYTLGFQMGDRVLQHVGIRLQGLVGTNDLVARLSGGEFAVVLDKVAGIEDAQRLAHDIQRNLEAPFRIDDQPFEFGAHIGIALHPQHADNSAALIRHAEAAMNHAHTVPGGIGVYSMEFDRQNQRRLTLIGEARQALNTDQFQLYYQPKLDLKSRRVVGVEALVRWRHPEHGFISPAEFIPVIEQTALVGPFTLSVLNLGLKQAAAWHASGLALRMSLNLSARNLQDTQLPEQFGQLLKVWAVPPERIVLEITESALMVDPASSTKVIAQLDALGAGLSIDDYGTGYSSLSFLRQLPLDELKIDKSFVLHMDTDANDEVIVRSTVDLAHNLGFKVVAEGVETVEVLEKLGAIGCDSIQGYYISKPQPADALEAWLRESPYRPA
ncbi:MAG: EAL domain-containing protein, partial [Gammaproteobacteria bacterium]